MSFAGKRRAYGQHFLKDPAVIARIVDTGMELAREQVCEQMLEIGPGRGAITVPLLEALIASPDPLKRLVVAERDRELVSRWEDWSRMNPSQNSKLRIEPGDFLELPEERWLPRQGKLAVVSNLPYSAGTAIVIRLARYPEKIPFMVLMFQAEVAKRLRAEPGTKEWGSLSIWIQNHWDVTRLIGVPPRAFHPAPKVDSEVVVLRARAEPRVDLSRKKDGEKVWDNLLRVAFAHRRKMLRAGLPSNGPWKKALEASGIDPTRRSEALSWDEWRKFFESLP
jgi:16S rRNA (adenine1518-N6/adenine1519-N6)-dimethyltransferase